MGGVKISLAAARVNAELTQRDVAKDLCVGKQTIVSWEKGRTEPKISQLKQLCKLYNVPMDYIFLPSKSIKNGLKRRKWMKGDQTGCPIAKSLKK